MVVVISLPEIKEANTNRQAERLGGKRNFIGEEVSPYTEYAEYYCIRDSKKIVKYRRAFLQQSGYTLAAASSSSIQYIVPFSGFTN